METKEKDRIETELSKKGLYPDKLTKSKNIWTFKRSYFYKMGQSATKIAEEILKALPEATILSSENQFKRWPATSWFVVKFEIAKKENF